MLKQADNIDFLSCYASEKGIDLHKACIERDSPFASKIDVWPVINDDSEDEKESYIPDLISSGEGDLLTEMAKDLSKDIQFPPNSIFLYGMGVVAAALVKSFNIKYRRNKKLPVNCYVVVSQPPSTGKSAINECFSNPIHAAYAEINKENKPKRKVLLRQLANLEKEAEKAKDEITLNEKLDQIMNLESQLDECYAWNPILTDTTIEGAMDVASSQGGMFNIVSDEADAVNVIVGAAYADSMNSKKNYGLVLNAWDGGFIGSARVGRGQCQLFSRASIAILAQDSAVDTILAAGASGRGVSERFYLLDEPNWLGKRNRFNQYESNRHLYDEYDQLIKNVINEKEVTLSLNLEAWTMLKTYCATYEKDMGDDGEYSRSMLRGFIGKAEKHMVKIAAILHCVDNWGSKGQKKSVIEEPYISRANILFSELAKTYISSGDNLGHVGHKSEVEKVKSTLISYAEKKKTKVTVSTLVSAIKGRTPFIGVAKPTKKIKEEIIPVLEKMNYCVLFNNEIYINPRLK